MVGVLVVPVLAGLAGTVLPAFGWLPALGGHGFTLQAWHELQQQPGLVQALVLSLFTGWSATLLSLALAVGLAAHTHARPWAQRLGDWAAPLLATPHAALALGLAFLWLPSGWLLRWVSPELTGWQRPPDLATVGHPSGWPLVLALVIKELPYLLLVLLAAQQAPGLRAQWLAARSLGYAPNLAWWRVVWPQVAGSLRLPTLAVLAFSLSVVDVALILGPSHPPTLAVLAVRAFADPNLQSVFVASAAALLLLAAVAASLLVWLALARTAQQRLLQGAASGMRHSRLGAWPPLACLLSLTLLTQSLLALLGLLLHASSESWRWPAVWPDQATLRHWQGQSAALAMPLAHTLLIGLLATLLAAVLVVASLESEPPRPSNHAGAARPSACTWLLYLPLLVPQVAFLFGLQVLWVWLGWDGSLAVVVATHLVFVLPYVYLSLAESWRAFDARYSRSALSLGASRARVLWRIKLPLLAGPLLAAMAVGFAVSAAQYLPTLFAGAGRVATLTTEAVTLAGGNDRRVIGVWASLQAALPLLVYLLAVHLPRRLNRAAPAPQ
jgi:putative thiamine transport system permease protein